MQAADGGVIGPHVVDDPLFLGVREPGVEEVFDGFGGQIPGGLRISNRHAEGGDRVEERTDVEPAGRTRSTE